MLIRIERIITDAADSLTTAANSVTPAAGDLPALCNDMSASVHQRLARETHMKRILRSIVAFSLSAVGLCAAYIPNAMAANPTAVVVMQCMETSSSYSVVTYNSYNGPAEASSSNCAETVESVLNDGLINVNVSVQTYTATGGEGAPGEVDGTYITYVFSNGTVSGGL